MRIRKQQDSEKAYAGRKILVAFLMATFLLATGMIFTVSASAVTYTGEYDLSTGSVTISSTGTYRIYQTGYETAATTNTVSVSAACTIVLDGVNIEAPGPEYATDYANNSPIDITGSYAVTVTLADGKVNRLSFAVPRDIGDGYKLGSGRAALHVPGGANLTVNGDGTLYAAGAVGINNYNMNLCHGGGGAGIGSNGGYTTGNWNGSSYPGIEAEACGNITIESGTVYANGGDSGGAWGAGGSGIGGGGGRYYYGAAGAGGNCGNITINGGSVYATAGACGSSSGDSGGGTAVGGGANGGNGNTSVYGVGVAANMNSFTFSGGIVIAVSSGNSSALSNPIDSAGLCAFASTSSDGANQTGYNKDYNKTYKYVKIFGSAIIYNANDGANAPQAQYYETQTVSDVVSSTVPFRARYMFLGWATTEDGTPVYMPGSQISISGVTTLYAVWSPVNTQLTGTSVTGTGSVTATVTGAITGDTYLNISTFEMYLCTAENTWQYIGCIKGDTGAAGAQGIQGVKGDKGDTGAKGADGVTPHIGENGNWFIGEVDTGIASQTVLEYVVDIKSDDSGVQISTDKDGLLRGTELKVEEISSQIGNNLTEEAAQKLHSTLTVVSENAEIVSAFDISLMLDGAKVQPDGMVKIRIPVPANANKYNDLTVVYVADDGTVTRINTELSEDGFLEFETDHFSTYAVAGVPVKNQTVLLWILIPIITVILITGVVLAVYLTKKKKA